MPDRYGAAQPIADAFQNLPRNVIEGLLGHNMGQKVEGWLGMPLDATGATMVSNPDPNYHQQMLENANRGFLQQSQHQAQPMAPRPAPRRMMPQR